MWRVARPLHRSIIPLKFEITKPEISACVPHEGKWCVVLRIQICTFLKLETSDVVTRSTAQLTKAASSPSVKTFHIHIAAAVCLHQSLPSLFRITLPINSLLTHIHHNFFYKKIEYSRPCVVSPDHRCQHRSPLIPYTPKHTNFSRP